MRILRLVCTSSIALLGLAAAMVAAPAPAITLRAGPAAGANVAFAFDVDTRPQKIVLRTARVGVLGSRIEVTVGHSSKPVFSHLFAPGECKFGSDGGAREVVIPSQDAAYQALIAGFKRGRLARVTVLDAGVMKMDQTVSLKGFAHAVR